MEYSGQLEMKEPEVFRDLLDGVEREKEREEAEAEGMLGWTLSRIWDVFLVDGLDVLNIPTRRSFAIMRLNCWAAAIYVALDQ
ncbi:hypothetical protein BT96DRAFT_984161 [Gymnopus androsaceus JB14]|uniref:Uncharacterized protein n=1 Tax=Gymnopus androsaceus JB14 TaxID=1447944 RepID=A0A6A4IMY6_9AGAR|nr:hypothetical protein BT96DRAFT_984161 [Gymnopus androsaceus JB14]